MNATQQNGGAYAPPRREKIVFSTNVPQFVTLEFEPPTEAREGRFGDQFMYFLQGEKIMFLDPEAHAAVVACGAKAGSEVAIQKRELRNAGRRHIQWEAQLVEEEPTAAQLAPPPAAAPAIARPAPAQLAAKPAARPTPTQLSGADRITGNLMTAALTQALEAVHEAGLAEVFRPEDIRALAITIYIQATGSSRK